MKLLGKCLMLLVSFSLINISFALEEGSYKGKTNYDEKFYLLVRKVAEREGSYIALLIKSREMDQVSLSSFILDTQDQSKMVGYYLSLDSRGNLSHNFTQPGLELIESGKTFTLVLKESNTSIVFKDKNDSYTWSWPGPGRYENEKGSDYALSIGAFNPSTQSISGLDQRTGESFVLNRLMFGLLSQNIVNQVNGETIQQKEGARMGVHLTHKGFLSQKNELHLFDHESVSTVYKLKN